MLTGAKGEKVKKKRVIIDIYLVISETVLLVLEPEPKMKGIGKLVSWGTLPTIDNIKRNLDNPDFLTISWRKVDIKEPWVLQVLLPNNANDCVSLILKHLKTTGLVIDKKYQKFRKLKESEVTAEGVMQAPEVDLLLKTISQYEQVIWGSTKEGDSSSTINPSTVSHLIQLYNQAIEYYSVTSDDKLNEFMQKLRDVMGNEKLQKILEDADRGAN